MTRLNFTLQESSPLITYSGWVEGSSANDTFSSSYNGSFRVTFTANATASFKFSGTAVSLFGATRANHGNYSVGLDHQPLFVASGSTGTNVFNTSLWHADNLGYTEHTVVLTNIPTQTGTFLDLDYVSIERQIGQDGDHIFQTTLDDATPAPVVRYSGSWEQTTGRDTANAGTLHSTMVAGSQAVITFNGCCVELYGQYANAPYSVALDNQPLVNMTGLDVDLTPDFQHPRTLLYLVDGLSEGKHTVTLTNTKSNVNRPFFFDYAIVSSTQNISSLPPASQTPGESTAHGSLGSRNKPIGEIVGAVVGAVAFVALLILLLFFVRRRRRLRDAKRMQLDLDLLDPSELEPKPYVLPNHVESQDATPEGAPQLNHSHSGGYIHPSKRHQMPNYYPQAASSSSEGLLSPQEQSSAGGSRSYSAPSSTGSSTNMSATSTSRSASTPRRDTKSDVSHSHDTQGESSQHPAVQEEDAGVVIPSEDQPIVRSLPPAYNPEWDRRENS